MKLTLVVEVKGLKNNEEASDFALDLADHIMKTFNDDGSIKGVTYGVVTTKPKKGDK